jgi:hypothetical protein
MKKREGPKVEGEDKLSGTFDTASPENSRMTFPGRDKCDGT